MIITVGFKKRIYFQWTWTHPYLTSWPSAVFYSLDGLLSIWYIPHFHSQLYSIVAKFQEHEYSYLILKCVYCVFCTGVCLLIFPLFRHGVVKFIFDLWLFLLYPLPLIFKFQKMKPSSISLFSKSFKKKCLEHLFWPERKLKWRS